MKNDFNQRLNDFKKVANNKIKDTRDKVIKKELEGTLKWIRENIANHAS